MRFTTVIEQSGRTATGFEVPAHVVEALGGGKRAKVNVTINGTAYRSSLASMGGRFLVPLSAENRALTGTAAGDEVEVELALDTAAREVDVPADLAAALATDPAARAGWNRLPYSHRLRHVLAIEEAKKEQTRRRRVERALDMLRGDT
jgi:hypothetical protein